MQFDEFKRLFSELSEENKAKFMNYLRTYAETGGICISVSEPEEGETS